MAESKFQKWTILALLRWSEDYFKKLEIDSPRLTAEILICHVLDIRRIDLYLQFDRPLNLRELAAYKKLVQRRALREPVAYITGRKGFWELEFEVDSNVLIPRPDTETLLSSALQVISRKKRAGHFIRVLELGTGSGAVIVSIAAALENNCVFYATDVSCAALDVARKNHRVLTGNKHINFVSGAWFSCFKRKPSFDLIISNPPYIPTADIASLQPEIREYEPFAALDGGDDGLDSIRHIIGLAWEFLHPEGILLLEMGAEQKKGIKEIVSTYSQYKSSHFIKDEAGHNRVVLLEKADGIP